MSGLPRKHAHTHHPTRGTDPLDVEFTVTPTPPMWAALWNNGNDIEQRVVPNTSEVALAHDHSTQADGSSAYFSFYSFAHGGVGGATCQQVQLKKSGVYSFTLQSGVEDWDRDFTGDSGINHVFRLLFNEAGGGALIDVADYPGFEDVEGRVIERSSFYLVDSVDRVFDSCTWTLPLKLDDESAPARVVPVFLFTSTTGEVNDLAIYSRLYVTWHGDVSYAGTFPTP